MTRKKFCPLGYATLSLGLAVAPLSVAVAAQNIVIDSAVTHSVYGNGDPSDNGSAAPPQSGYISGLAPADGNSLAIRNGSVTGSVIGGYNSTPSSPVTANYNTVTFNNGSASSYVYGGYANSADNPVSASYNKVVVENGGMVAWSIYGGSAYGHAFGSATATDNEVIIDGGKVGGEAPYPLSIFGGWADSDFSLTTVTENKVVVENGSVVDWRLYGGYGTSVASSNIEVSGNSVTIRDSEVKDEIAGGGARNSSGVTMVTGNTVTIDSGLVSASVYGGRAETTSGPAEVSHNSVIINGGEVEGNIYGGSGSSASPVTATNNTVTISGAPTFGDNTILYGGYTSGIGAGDAWTGNTLNLHAANLTVAGLQNFQNLNFYLPTTLANGGTMLTVTGMANINHATVNVGIDGASSPLRAGDSVILINAGTLAGAQANPNSTGTGMQGVTLLYDFDLSAYDNKLVATVAGNPGPARVNPESESLSQGFLSGLGLLNQGADLIAGWGMTAAVEAAMRPNLDTRYGLGIFGAVAAGRSRYDTGSSVDVSGYSLMTGVSKRVDTRAGNLVVGAFFEYGNGSYDTYAALHGNGDLDHYGGGIIGRFDFAGAKTGHFYTEASARIGSVDNDYSNGELRDALGREASYSASSTYYGIHFAAGYIWNLTDRAALDLYGRYFWTQQQGDTLRLSTGDPMDFDNINSHRMRLGTRFCYAAAENLSPYAGAAWEHEFDGEAKATTNGYALKKPSLEGDTGIAELGLTLKPSRTMPVTLDLGAQGYVGMREGVSGMVHLRYDF